MKIVLNKISKSYEKKRVIKDLDIVFNEGGKYVIKGESGSGKTTLLKLITGLEKPDSGTVEGTSDLKFSVVFQEDRLIEDLSGIRNVAIVCPHVPEEKIREELSLLLPSDSLDKPARELSGGMRRRLCIVRACLHDSDVLLMDEPLSGLDEANQKNVIEYIRTKIKDRIFIAASHSRLFGDFCEIIPVD